MKVLSKYEKNIEESKQVSEWLKQGNKKVIVPTKVLSWKQKLKMEKATIRGRGSIAFGGLKSNTGSLKLGTLSNMSDYNLMLST